MKTTLSLCLLFALAGASSALADTQTTVITTTTAVPVAVVRDGFSTRFAQVMITRDGVTKVMPDTMKLSNGVVIHPDGVIVIPGKMNKTLHSGDWLYFDGTLARGDSGRVEHLQPDPDAK
jgi:uncharacterized protein DUF6799